MGQHGLGESDTRTPGTEGEARGLQARSGTQARHRTARRRPQGWRSGGPSVSGQEAQGTPGCAQVLLPHPRGELRSPSPSRHRKPRGPRGCAQAPLPRPGVRSGPPPPSPGCAQAPLPHPGTGSPGDPGVSSGLPPPPGTGSPGDPGGALRSPSPSRDRKPRGPGGELRPPSPSRDRPAGRAPGARYPEGGGRVAAARRGRGGAGAAAAAAAAEQPEAPQLHRALPSGRGLPPPAGPGHWGPRAGRGAETVTPLLPRRPEMGVRRPRTAASRCAGRGARAGGRAPGSPPASGREPEGRPRTGVTAPLSRDRTCCVRPLLPPPFVSDGKMQAAAEFNFTFILFLL